MEEAKKESWLWVHRRFSIIFSGSVSIILVLFSMGFKNSFVTLDAGILEMNIFISYLLMFLAGMYFAAFYSVIIRWRKRD